MSNGDKDDDKSADIDEAAEPFMEQAKDALGDVGGNEDGENPANPSLLQSDRRGSRSEDGKRPGEDSR